MAALNPSAPEFHSSSSLNHLASAPEYYPSSPITYSPYDYQLCGAQFFHYTPNQQSISVYYCYSPFIHAPPAYYPWQTYSAPQPQALLLPPSSPPPTHPQASLLPTSPFAEKNSRSSKPLKGAFRGRFGFGKRYMKARFETDYKKWSTFIKSEWKPKEEDEQLVSDKTPPSLQISSTDEQSKCWLSEPIDRSGKKTTVMIRNIPNKYTRDMLLKLLDKHCMDANIKLESCISTMKNKASSAYDFVYLPIDFESKCNKGYAFVNFTEPVAAWRLNILLQNHKWGILNSKKICEVTYARIQGKEALKEQFEKTTFVCETEEYLPTYFSPPRDGSEEWVEQFVVGRRINPSGTQ